LLSETYPPKHIFQISWLSDAEIPILVQQENMNYLCIPWKQYQ
jgi:hypothetical protein